MNRAGDPASGDQRLLEVYRARLRRGDSLEHPDEAAWEAFASGTIEPEARRRLADHIVSCGPCRDVYEAVRVLMEGAPAIDLGAPAASVAPGATLSWRRHAPALAMAASLVVVVGLLATYVSRRPGEPAPVSTDSSAGTAPAPAGAPAGTAEPVGPTFRLTMVTPDVQLPADLITTTRGTAGAQARSFLDGFGHAIAPYREGDFDEAAHRLAALTRQHGDVAEVWFYLGVSHLFAGRPAEALAAFDHPGLASAIGDDLLWQRAVALERLNRPQESDVVLRTLCRRDGPHHARACAALANDGQAPQRN